MCASKKLAVGDLFRRGCAASLSPSFGGLPGGKRRKECLRPWRKLPARPAKPGDTNAFGGAARPLRTSRRLVRARGPAARGGGCSEARFLRRKGARNAHAVRGAEQGRIHGASGGRGDAPAAAGNGRTRRGFWRRVVRRARPGVGCCGVRRGAFLAPFRRSKRLRGVGVRGRTAPIARAVGAKRKKRGPCRRARAPLCLPGDEKIFFVKEILFINEKKFFSGRGKDEESPPPLGRRAQTVK